ncbi:hypothetical protein IEQ34_008455 [Dendrobium chrysotoxum]|uniref:Uncharacterized protein n=1 Tax=Dendrobium chrysotoxum TaxID=161865 RepID=A0AAV7H056_DENCH|nr:hypothetical protein IEQ34_008455 [Dendrobium chrysotoxum]
MSNVQFIYNSESAEKFGWFPKIRGRDRDRGMGWFEPAQSNPKSLLNSNQRLRSIQALKRLKPLMMVAEPLNTVAPGLSPRKAAVSHAAHLNQSVETASHLIQRLPFDGKD